MQGLDSFLRPYTVHVCMCEGVVTYRALMIVETFCSVKVGRVDRVHVIAIIDVISRGRTHEAWLNKMSKTSRDLTRDPESSCPVGQGEGPPSYTELPMHWRA